MRLNATLVGLLLAVSNPLAASSFKGVTLKGVILANEDGGPPIANVQVSVIDGANAVSSLSNGTFVLEVAKQPGEPVRLILQKQGMVVVNAYELEFNLPKPENVVPLTFLLCREVDFQEMKRRYYRVDSVDPIAQSHRKKPEDSQAKTQATEVENEQLRDDLDPARKEAAAEKLRIKAEEVSEPYIHGEASVYRSNEAMALNRAGTVYRRQNQPEKARKAYDEALKRSRNLAEQDPLTYLPDVADTLNNLGDMLSDQNRVDEALTIYDEALRITRNLAQRNATYLPNVAMTLNNRGTLLRKLNRVEDERQAFDEALKLYRQLTQLNPTIYVPHVAETLTNVGTLNLEQNLWEKARKVFKEVLAIYETLANQNAGQYGQEVETTRGLLEAAFDGALKSYRAGAQLDPSFLPNVAETLNNLGILNLDQNRIVEARKALSEAFAIYVTLAKQNLQQYEREALLIYATLARINAAEYEEEVEATGRLLEAAFDAALKSYREQARRNRTYLSNVAETLNSIGTLNRCQNRLVDAGKAYSEALAIYETLAKKNPGTNGQPGPYEGAVKSIRKLLDDLTESRKALSACQQPPQECRNRDSVAGSIDEPRPEYETCLVTFLDPFERALKLR